MSQYEKVHLGQETIRDLEDWVRGLGEVTPFTDDLSKSALLLSYAMMCELGGINDNLALHIHDALTGAKINRSSLVSDLVSFNGMVGLEVTSLESARIEVRIPGFKKFIRITGSGFVIFPELIARELVRENIEPVLVKRWLLQTTFSGCDPRTKLYKDDMWELIENDAYTYARLISERKMVLQGLHDVVDHAPSAQSDGWAFASTIAKEMSEQLSLYYHPNAKGNIASHLLPFAAGVILDELTQMPHYKSAPRAAAIRALIAKVDRNKIDPGESLALRDFPISIDDVTDAVRRAHPEQGFEFILDSVEKYSADVHALTYRVG